LKLKPDEVLSSFAFNFNLCRYSKGAEAGLPKAMYALGCCLDEGSGLAAPDYPAAADWYWRAAEAGDENGANNLSNMYTVGRGGARQIMPFCQKFSGARQIITGPGR
jgi:TPR repeat protein